MVATESSAESKAAPTWWVSLVEPRDSRRPLVDEERQRVRAMDVKAARLAPFAIEQPEDIKDAPWDRWIGKWNASSRVRANPSWRCCESKMDRDNFVRAVKDAHERLSRTEWLDPSESRRCQPPYQNDSD